MKIKKLSTALSSLLIVFAATGSLHAATIDTYTQIQRTGSPDMSDSDTGTTGTVHSEVESSISAGGYDEAAASASGNVSAETAVAASFSGTLYNNYNVSASVEWSETYNITSAGPYAWDFTITGGELSIHDYTPQAVELMAAGYSMEIFANGTSVWSSSALLEGDNTGYNYVETGTDIGGTIFGDHGSEGLEGSYGVRYDPYNGSASLGSYAVGDTLTMRYVLSVTVGGGPTVETGASAFFGDPGDLVGGGSGGMQGSLSSVPIPGALWLFGSAFLGMFGLRRQSAS